jgi:hypothetical protein
MDYFDGTYFDPSYFDTDDASPESGGGASQKRFRILVPPPAQVEKIDDDGWIHIIL